MTKVNVSERYTFLTKRENSMELSVACRNYPGADGILDALDEMTADKKKYINGNCNTRQTRPIIYKEI